MKQLALLFLIILISNNFPIFADSETESDNFFPIRGVEVQTRKGEGNKEISRKKNSKKKGKGKKILVPEEDIILELDAKSRIDLIEDEEMDED